MSIRARLARQLVFVGCGLLCSSAPVIAQVHPSSVRVAEAVTKTFVVKRVDPDYPPEAREKRIQGDVVLNVKISKKGT